MNEFDIERDQDGQPIRLLIWPRQRIARAGALAKSRPTPLRPTAERISDEQIAALLDEGAQALLEARVLLDPIYECDPDIRRWFEKWSFTRIAVSADASQAK